MLVSAISYNSFQLCGIPFPKTYVQVAYLDYKLFMAETGILCSYSA